MGQQKFANLRECDVQRFILREPIDACGDQREGNAITLQFGSQAQRILIA